MGNRIHSISRRNVLLGGGLMAAAARRVMGQQMGNMPGMAATRIYRPMKKMAPMPPTPPIVSPDSLAAFVDPLPIPPVAKPAGMNGSVVSYQIPIHEFTAKVHRDLPPTRFWGYGNSLPGPTIEARSGEEIQVEWPNRLPEKHFLPIDHNLMGAEKGVPESRTVVHVHGAKVPPGSDGWPEDWYVPGKSATYRYPNAQDAAMLWYHDHAMGINRLNMCAGMAGLYIVRDAFEDALNLPKGEFEIPLVLMDRMIRPDGQLFYPVSQVPDAPWVPEFFGDTVLINGKILPYAAVQPRKYRFRILNGSNARTFFLALDNGKPVQQIGTDQGLLSAPVPVSQMTIAPGERADIVIDFAEYRGTSLQLKSLGSTLMQFRVGSEAVTDSSQLPSKLRPIQRMAEKDAVVRRRLTTEEIDTTVGEPMVHLLDGKHWHDPISEKPVLGSTEIWEFINLTDDAHPIHLHLVRFQILDRRPIDSSAYMFDNKMVYLGDASPPDANEAGWKDTVRATPGASTRIIVKFEGYAGRYVWHCHILEHEDNEMMRPYEVVAKA
jgi:spore coat protein A